MVAGVGYLDTIIKELPFYTYLLTKEHLAGWVVVSIVGLILIVVLVSIALHEKKKELRDKLSNKLTPLYDECFGIVKRVEDDLNQIGDTYSAIKKRHNNNKHFTMAQRNTTVFHLECEVMEELFGGRVSQYGEEHQCIVNIFDKHLPALRAFKDNNFATLDSDMIELIECYVDSVSSFIKGGEFSTHEDGVIDHLTNHNDERVFIFNNIKKKIKQQ